MKRFLSVALILVSVLVLSAVTVIDDAGRVVTLPRVPTRIVSLSPSATRFLIFLGLEDRIVGVTDFDEYDRAERVGMMVPVNLEKVVALKPDLVVTFGGFQLPEVPKLERAGLNVLVINPTSLNDVIRGVMLLGTVFGVQEKARNLAEELNNKMIEMGKKTYNVPPDKRPKVLFMLSSPGPDVKEIWTCGAGSYLNDLISLAGGVNIAAGIAGPNGWPQVSLEYVVAQNPDVILVGVYVPGTEKQEVEKVKNFTPFKSVNAVKSGRIFPVDGNLASQPSPDIFQLLDVFHSFFYGGKGN